MDEEERIGDLLGWDALTRMSVAGEPWQLVTEAEAEIARRGLRADYLDALARETGWPGPFVEMSQWGKRDYIHAKDFDQVWDMLTAPPDVRVRAMLRALGEG